MSLPSVKTPLSQTSEYFSLMIYITHPDLALLEQVRWSVVLPSLNYAFTHLIEQILTPYESSK